MRVRILGAIPIAAAAALISACGGAPAPTPPAAVRPSILLVTLDTTRADAIGPDARGVATPAFNALAARGQRFTQAYTTVPETLHCVSVLASSEPVHRFRRAGCHACATLVS